MCGVIDDVFQNLVVDCVFLEPGFMGMNISFHSRTNFSVKKSEFEKEKPFGGDKRYFS